MTTDGLARAPAVAEAFEDGADTEYSAEVTELRRVHDYDAALSMNTGLTDEALAAVGVDRYKYVRMGENGRYESVTVEAQEGDDRQTMGFKEALRANKGISDDSLAELGIERDALVSDIN